MSGLIWIYFTSSRHLAAFHGLMTIDIYRVGIEADAIVDECL